ncbi:ETX/MTX2 family pore-forming toxin, partial [Bacillus mycoides]|uniref:ETX/MTX2 family pore-forming toxin n=1 Tax=Bacillus mycoides TaxID=1405 RepID=UPI0021118DDB
NSDQYREINTKAINESYSQTLTKKTLNITESIQSSKQLTVTHNLNTGTKEGLKSSLGVSVPLIGEVKGELSFEYSINYGYTNAFAKIDTITHTVTSPQKVISLAPRTGAVVMVKLSTPVYKTKLLGTSRIKGYYTDQVNTYPTWVQLGIYNKFKVISQHNPTIWNKLKELGFALDDQTKEVIFKGVIDLTDRHAPGSTFESHTQIYELDADGNINYNKPVGEPQTEVGQVQQSNILNHTS